METGACLFLAEDTEVDEEKVDDDGEEYVAGAPVAVVVVVALVVAPRTGDSIAYITMGLRRSMVLEARLPRHHIIDIVVRQMAWQFKR